MDDPRTEMRKYQAEMAGGVRQKRTDNIRNHGYPKTENSKGKSKQNRIE